MSTKFIDIIESLIYPSGNQNTTNMSLSFSVQKLSSTKLYFSKLNRAKLAKWKITAAVPNPTKPKKQLYLATTKETKQATATRGQAPSRSNTCLCLPAAQLIDSTTDETTKATTIFTLLPGSAHFRRR